MITIRYNFSLNFRPQHQVIFMKDVDPAEMEYLLQFIYLGEVDIPSTDLERLIAISRELGIVGLNAVKSEKEMVEEETGDRRYEYYYNSNFLTHLRFF